MKRLLNLFLLSFLLVFLGTSYSSCSKKTGCPMNEYTKKNKKLSNKRGKTNLFPKNMRKKRKG
ncbi:MAG: hypothetical protein AAF985_15060 [Bacteroidota bacterium]